MLFTFISTEIDILLVYKMMNLKLILLHIKNQSEVENKLMIG